MKKTILFLGLLTILASCKKEIVKTPVHLIEKGKMINIMYDMSILESIKAQNPSTLETYKINPNEYVYKKYKIDSIQFSQNNIYYASDYKEYKGMNDQVKLRLDKYKSSVENLIKEKKKKEELLKKEKEKLKTKRVSDSIEKRKKRQVKEADSIKKSKERK